MLWRLLDSAAGAKNAGEAAQGEEEGPQLDTGYFLTHRNPAIHPVTRAEALDTSGFMRRVARACIEHDGQSVTRKSTHDPNDKCGLARHDRR